MQEVMEVGEVKEVWEKLRHFKGRRWRRCTGAEVTWAKDMQGVQENHVVQEVKE